MESAEAIMPERPARSTYLRVAGGGAGDAGDDAEDGAEAVVDAVDGVADPRAGLLAALVALGQHLVEHGFGVDFGRAGGGGIVAAQQRAELAVVVFLVLDDVLENGDGAFVAEGFELLAVAWRCGGSLRFQGGAGPCACRRRGWPASRPRRRGCPCRQARVRPVP